MIRIFTHRVLAAILAATFTSAYSLADEFDRAKVISELRSAEQQLENIYVNSRVNIDEANSVNSPVWNETPKLIECKAWLNASLDGPFRLDVKREVISWTGQEEGKLPFGEEEYSVVYDGKKFIRLQLRQGEVGTKEDSTAAVVLPSEKSERGSPAYSYSSGVIFSLNFAKQRDAKSLSEFIENANPDPLPNNAKPRYEKFERTQLDGNDVVKVTIGYPDILEEMWFLDPSRGWAVLGYEFRQGIAKHLRHKIVINKLEPVGKNLWYPSSAEFQIFHMPSKDVIRGIRFRYQAKEIKANTPDVAAAIDEFVIPAGTRVNDGIEHKIYTVAPPDDKMSQAIDKTLRDAVLAATQPSTQPSTQPRE